MTGYERVLKVLKDAGLTETEQTDRLTARCPAHDDRRASLSVAAGDDGRALVYCFAGCPTPEVVEALDLDMADLFTTAGGEVAAAAYVYTDEEGRPLLRVLRTWPKGFTQERWDESTGTWRSRLLDTRRVPYRLPELLAADNVWLVEGEKDADAVRKEDPGSAATTLLGGAGKWRPEYERYFRGKTVTFVADNDAPGIEGVLKVKNALRGVAKGLQVYRSPEGKDVTDLFNAGFGLGDLEPYVVASDDLFEPQNWSSYTAEETEWLFEPYVPRASRVMAFGPAGSLKSLWAMWLAVRLSKAGHRVAYFSLEMRPGETAKRLRKMDPPADRFKWYQRFQFTNASHLDAACDLLRGYSLIVVDSWSAAATQMELRDSNNAVALLDQEVFQPLISETGAALLVLDNTGHPALTERGKLQPDWARGASAKGDKMDVTLLFSRPDEGDNRRCTIRVKKMRLDRKIPPPVTVWTDPDDIEFHVVGSKGEELGPLWDYFGAPAAWEAPPGPERPASLLDRLRLAKERAVLREQKLGSSASEKV